MPTNPYTDSFAQGAKMFLEMQGIKNEREQQQWMRQLQTQQLGMRQQEFGLHQEKLGMERQQMQIENMRMIAEIQKAQAAMQKEQERKAAVARYAGVNVTPEGITERNIPEPGKENAFWGNVYMQAAGDLGGDPDMIKLAQGLMPKADMSMSEAELLALPPNDPRRVNYIGGKQALGNVPKPVSMGNAAELAMTEKFPTWQNDPNIAQQARAWLGTPEGNQLIAKYSQLITPPAVTIQDTSAGLVKIQTKGPGMGTAEITDLKRKLPAEALGKVGELTTILENIANTKTLYGYGTAGEHGEWIGPIAGRKGGLEAKYLGSASPEQVKFYAYVKDMQDALLRARSGAQINEQEYQRLVNFLPDPNLPPATFKARLDRFEEATKIILQSKLSAFSTGGYGIPDVSAQMGTTKFVINGKTYNIPNELVPQFKKEKGIK